MTIATFTLHILQYNLFLQDTISIKHKVDAFYLFLYFSGLKPNLKKSKIGGIEALKEVQVASCGLRCIDLNNDPLKILGTHFSYNEKWREEKKYKTVTDTQRVLKTWKKRNFTLEGNIVISKTIAVSKIVFQSFITTVPKHIINKLEKNTEGFSVEKLYC